ncbi:Uncharacterised protein [Pseudomonas aeruginosa]|nr:Uncharacterised protein [Pseudomonas aeruginosa]
MPWLKRFIQRRRAQQPRAADAEQGPTGQARQRNQEEQQCQQADPPGLSGAFPGEQCQRGEGHHPGLGIDQLQRRAAEHAEAPRRLRAVDAARAAEQAPGQVAEPADAEPGEPLLEQRMASQQLAQAEPEQQDQRRHRRAGAEHDRPGGGQAVALAVAQDQDVGRSGGDRGDDGEQQEGHEGLHGRAPVAWEPSSWRRAGPQSGSWVHCRR